MILTPRQRRIIILRSQGHTDKEIAAMLGYEASAIKNALYAARKKNGCRNTCHLVGMMAAHEIEKIRAQVIAEIKRTASMTPTFERMGVSRRLFDE